MPTVERYSLSQISQAENDRWNGGTFISFDGGETLGEINDGMLGATIVFSIVVDPQSSVYAVRELPTGGTLDG